MSKIAGGGGMEKNVPKIAENKFNGRNFNYKSRKSMIEGRIEALRGHIYGCTENRQANLDTTTTKEIAGYAAITLNMAMT